MRAVIPFEDLAQDVRFGLRSLARQRGLTAAAVATLALGIGALTTLASVVRSVLLEPLPYPESPALVQLWESRARTGRVRGNVSPADFVDWRASSRTFDSVAAFSETSFNVSGDGMGEPLRLDGALVSADFFTVLRASAAFGRALDAEDDEPGAPKVAVIGNSLSRRLFGRSASAIGSRVFVDGVPREIVGVLPPWFEAPRPASGIFLPLALGPEEKSLRALHYLFVLARLRPDVSLEEAREEMRVIAARLEGHHLRGLPPSMLPRASEIRLDVVVLLIALAGSLVTGLLFGLAPALQTFKLSPGIEAMGKQSLAPGGEKLRSVLVVSQVALALVLAVGAVLLARSLSLLLEVEPGLVRERLLTAEFSLPEARYPSAASREEFFRALHERVSSTEGVLNAATVTAAPLRGPSGSRYFEIENAPPTAPGEGRNATFNLVSPGYFETLGIPFLRGLDFTGADDREGAAVAIVSDAMARRFWKEGEDPLGERIRVGRSPGARLWASSGASAKLRST